MIRFDYLRDPRMAVIDYLRELHIPPGIAAAGAALITACVAVVALRSVERATLSNVGATVASEQARYDALSARLVRERIEAGEVEDLGAIDGRLRVIGRSTDVLRERLIRIANLTPREVWLISLQLDTGHDTFAGRSATLSGVARTLDAFGKARLVRVDRLEGGQRAMLQFAAESQ